MSDWLVVVGCAGMGLSIAVKLIVVQCLRARDAAAAEMANGDKE
ncbi:hypothetical protein ACFOLJ_02765 [Rugamonas sp. CCM 8940]|nr:hypothetical protein [Rugamonas sp. CCM 8940]